MLHGLRKWASSKYAAVLIVLLVVSFAIWGIGDFAVTGGSNVVEGNNIRVTQNEYVRAFERTRRGLERQQGRGISIAEARQIGLDQGVAQELAAQAVLEDFYKETGFAAPASLIAKTILDMPDFQDANGKFSQDLFVATLRSNGFDEEEAQKVLGFSLKQDAYSNFLLRTGGQSQAIANFLWANNNLQATYLEKLVSVDVQAVNREQIQKYFDDNQDSYQQPATHRLRVLTIDKDALTKQMRDDFSEEELRSFFEEQKQIFEAPERRDILQYRINADANIDDVLSQIRANTAIDQLEGAVGLKLDARTQDSLPLDVANVVFSLEEGGISEPVSTALGRLIFKIERIIPAAAPEFDNVVDEIRTQMSENTLPERLENMFNDIDDAVASGTKLDDIKNIPGLVVEDRTIEQDGLAQGLGTDDASIIDQVVGQLPGDEPLGFVRDDLVPVFVSKLAVTDARPATFDEVSAQVAKDASAAQTREAREQAVKDALDDFSGIEPQTKSRVELSQLYPASFVARLLSQTEPQIFRLSDDQAVLLQITSLTQDNSTASQALVEAVSSELIGEGQNDLLDDLVKRENPQILVGNLEQALSRFSQ